MISEGHPRARHDTGPARCATRDRVSPGINTISIGNQTSFSAPSPTFPFDYAIDHGFDAFEFFPDSRDDGGGFCIDDFDTETRRDLANLAVAHGVRLSVHAPWWMNPLSEGAVHELLPVLAFAHDLGAKVFNIHLYHEQGIPSFVAAIEPLAQKVAAAGLHLAIENTVETTPEHFNQLFTALQAEDPAWAKCCGMCFDMGHANLVTATRNDYLAYVDRLEPHVPIIHGHIHENWGDCDSHLTLFTGPAGHDPAGVLGLIERLQRRGFQGSLILEQWPEPPELLVLARDRLRFMLGSGP